VSYYSYQSLDNSQYYTDVYRVLEKDIIRLRIAFNFYCNLWLHDIFS